MSIDFGPPLKLATKQQLAVELTDREDGMAVCAFERPDGTWDATSVMPAEFGDPPNAPAIFRWLAQMFENCENLPRPDSE